MEEEKQEFNKETLMNMISEILNTYYTVDDVIKRKQERDLMVMESFDQCFINYKILSKTQKKALKALFLSKIKFYLHKIVLYIKNPSLIGMINETIEKLDELKQDIKKENVLLEEIKYSLVELYKYNAMECNQDLNALMALISLRIKVLFARYYDFVEVNNSLLSGFTYISNKDFDKDILEIEHGIEEVKLRLGFHNE